MYWRHVLPAVGNAVRVDVSDVAGVRICLEGSINDGGWGVSVHRILVRPGMVRLVLCSDVSYGRVRPRCDVLDVVLVENLLVNHSDIPPMLIMVGLEKGELHREQDAEENGCEDRDARSRVELSGREEQVVYEHVSRAEEAEEPETKREGVPHRDLPHVSARVRMRAGLRRNAFDQLRDEAQRRRGHGRAIDSHSLRGWRRRRRIHGGFKQTVVALAVEGVAGVDHGESGQD